MCGLTPPWLLWLKKNNFTLTFHICNVNIHIRFYRLSTKNKLEGVVVYDIKKYTKCYSQKQPRRTKNRGEEKFVPVSRRSNINYFLRLQKGVWLAKLYFYTKNEFHGSLQAFSLELKYFTVVQLSCVLLDKYHKRKKHCSHKLRSLKIWWTWTFMTFFKTYYIWMVQKD